ncbi:hypothetical protein [Methylobacterium trifolii]|uniref:hypothetical protein n=1 Tax=Methylobacterium trifolii TaxID=1003092 RepID=UPI001EE01B43|nr:hypothetical protein [Methylobacterium trifolii]
MASTDQLAEAYVQMLASFRPAAPLTFMNHDGDGAALIIAAIVDRCASVGLGLREVVIGTELADHLGLKDGIALKHGEQPIIRVEADLGRQVRFEVR